MTRLYTASRKTLPAHVTLNFSKSNFCEDKVSYRSSHIMNASSDRFHDYAQDIPMRLSSQFFSFTHIVVPDLDFPSPNDFSELKYSFDLERRARKQFDDFKAKSDFATSYIDPNLTQVQSQTVSLPQQVLLPHPYEKSPAPSTTSALQSSFSEFESQRNVFDEIEWTALDDRAALNEVLKETTCFGEPPPRQISRDSPQDPIKLASNTSKEVRHSKEHDLRLRLIEKGFRPEIVQICIKNLPRARLVHIEYYMKGIRMMEKSSVPVNDGLNFLLQSELNDKQSVLKYAETVSQLVSMGFNQDVVFSNNRSILNNAYWFLSSSSSLLSCIFPSNLTPPLLLLLPPLLHVPRWSTLLACRPLMFFVVFLGISSLSIFSCSPEKWFSDSSVGEFRELLIDVKAGAVFVGAEGAVYRLWAYNVNDTNENSFTKKTLSLTETEETECRAMGNTEQMCRPSTRFISLFNGFESLYVCSSVGMKPEIRVLDAVTLKDQQEPRTEIGICAPDETVNSTAVIVEWGNPDDIMSVYSGIRTGMAGENHLIYRPPLVKNGRQAYPNIRTIYTDNKWLNEPQFVASFEVAAHVFFFFREIAYENAFGDRIVHSRIARVCKKDMGGRNVLRQVWTSFLKARLNCSISADYPFYFDHIQSVAKVEKNGETNFYASFSTSNTAFVSSAVCVFSLSSINNLLDNAPLMEESRGGVVLSPTGEGTSAHRPGSCSRDSHSISDSELHFVKSHLLLAESIPGSKPINPLRDVVYTHVLVDPLPHQNVVFLFDSNGETMWKVAHWKESNEWKSKLIEKRKIEVGGKVNSAALLPSEFFYVSTPDRVLQYSVAVCEQYEACSLCTTDPYCSWNLANSSCHTRHRAHETSIGWVSQAFNAGEKLSPECQTTAHTSKRVAYLGDSVRFDVHHPCRWYHDSVEIAETARTIFNVQGDVVILNLQTTDAGIYECRQDSVTIFRTKLTVNGDCVKPTTVEAYRSCQREWCKKSDEHQMLNSLWKESQRKNAAQCR
ncbi:unnamed protein product [Caenorhabditis auriculariae]|uniref:Sema domain-containing protein n=1 Tax=Caenorhabditis auriculariae TaxID=2777116 RepID=A0A8S1GZ14_9PELO|nr:unnamed protein product [Caenorhabditis auriculariae]